MSSARTAAMTCSRAARRQRPGLAEHEVALPNTISVGIERMLRRPRGPLGLGVHLREHHVGVRLGRGLEGRRELRHGPHHEAQKSTSTIPFSRTVGSKLVPVTAIVDIRSLFLSMSGRYPFGYREPQPP